MLDPFGSSRVRDANELVDHALGDRRRQQRVAAGDDTDRVEELLGRIVLQDEAAGAGAERLVHVFVEIERGQDEDTCRVIGGKNAPRRFEPIQLGHTNVHEHDRRPKPYRLLDRFEPVIMSVVEDVLRTGGKAGKVPELWDGKAAERIAAVLREWLDRKV